MTLGAWVLLAVRLFVAASVGLGLVLAIRQVRYRSLAAGRIVALGVLLRAALGLAAFIVSYAKLPYLAGLHTGDGFWALAPDGRMYFEQALFGLAHGIDTLNSGGPSVAYVRTFALWMGAVGISPASGFFLNLVCYVLSCWLLVRWFDGRPPRAALVALVGLTLSPALLIFGTQPLKDVFFALLIIAICWLVRWLARWWREPAAASLQTLLAALALMVAFYLVAGIRTYYAAFLWGGIFLTAVMSVVFSRGGRLRTARRGLVVLVVTWGALVVGAGSYYNTFIRPIFGLPAVASTPGDARRGYASVGAKAVAPVQNAARALESARRGFVRTGGATNLENDPMVTATTSGRLVALGVGLLSQVVPMSVLQATGIVSFQGGRGLIAATDLDTLFIDLTLAAMFLVMWQHYRRGEVDLVHALFVLAVSLVTLAALSYVVTNFGTLFRLRLMFVIPLWTLPLALHRTLAGSGLERQHAWRPATTAAADRG